MSRRRLTCECGYEAYTRLPRVLIMWHQEECDGEMEIHDV